MPAEKPATPNDPWDSLRKAGKELGDALTTLGHTLAAQTALAHLMNGEVDKATELLRQLPTEHAERAHRAAVDMGRILNGWEPTGDMWPRA